MVLRDLMHKPLLQMPSEIVSVFIVLVSLRVGDCLMKSNEDWSVPSHLSKYRCTYTICIMDENDGLNSVILYYNEYTGALPEWESLSD